MSAPARNKPPVDGTVEFVQHILPGLEAGAYRLDVAQTVSTQPQVLENTYFFAVQGPRFALDPVEVFATYPPDQGEGEFDGTLPHAVLTNRTLPWQRQTTLDEPDWTFPDNRHDRDVPGWLAVLVFDAEDEAAFPGFRAQSRSGTVRELFIRRTGNDAGQGYSYFWEQKDLGSDSQGLDKHLEYGQSPDDPCQIIDIPLALFWTIAPSCDDLKMTAHVRTVNVIRKATQNGVPAGRNDLSKVPGTSDFALVFGNRVPKAGVRTFAHLVSLERLEPFLPSDPATSANPAEVAAPSRVPGDGGFPIAAEGFLRLAVLQSWSFTSTGDSSHFEKALLALTPKTAARNNETPADFSMGLPLPPPSGTPSAAAAQARKALAMGYTALRHHTRDGGQTVSWYRGPLLPAQTAPDLLPQTMPSADAATRYDPASGMFDLGYAGAWQIGRLLAVQDKRFSTLLYNWRRENLRSAVSRMESLAVQRSLGAIRTRARQNDRLLSPLLAAFTPPAPPASATDTLRAVRGIGTLAHGRALRGAAQRTVLSDPQALQSLMQDGLSVPEEISAWLARLQLLEGVPFRYLVPDDGMLPPESIRFFHLDTNWVAAVLDGALSVGRQGTEASPETAHDTAVQTVVHGAASGQARTRRPAAFRMALPAPRPLTAVSGFLLRSEAVKGWPGLEVNGYATDGTLLDIVRFERLSSTVLLCLFEKDGKTLRQVDLHEPAEGLHFGLSGGTSVNVRYNHPSGDNGPGSQVPGVLEPAPFRGAGAGERTIRMFRLARALNDPKYRTYIDGIYEGFDHLPSSQFALQMLRGVGLVSFIIDGSAS